MDRTEVLQYIRQLKQEYNVQLYTPFKYFQGLTSKRQIKSRFLDILRGSDTPSKNSKSYRPFSTDIQASTRQYKSTKPSKYTKLFYEKYGLEYTSLKQKSERTGVPLDTLRKVYNKGKAAWRTGHRVGANQEQWGYARVHSFLMLGCTVFSADFTLFEEAIERMKPSQRKRWLSMKVQCPTSTLASAYYTKRETYKKFLAYKKKFIS
jgi:hypothetical protein